MKHMSWLIGWMLLIAGCAGDDDLADAYGNFEATEVTVSAEVGGTLERFGVREGTRLTARSNVGLIDTTQLALKRRQLRAQRAAAHTRTDQVRGEIDVVEAELDVARTEQARIERLVADSAATQRQLDDINGRVHVLERRIQATRVQLRTIRDEVAALDASIEQVDEQIRDSKLVAPIGGIVLTTHAEAHELVQPGAPLYTVADLDTLELRAYVSGAQLPSVRLGQSVTVLVDKNETENQPLNGTVAWIADEAEFTPRMIQTKEERVNLVYAIKVRVPNPDGLLKIGMPGEVRFE
jgi:HlyD family secretion protein